LRRSNKAIIFSAISCLILGFVTGVVAQRYYGMGNIVKIFYPEHKVPKMLVPQEFHGKLTLFILAGQSNMKGEGKVVEYIPLDTKGRVFVFTRDYKWTEAKEPLSGNGIGPGLAFAHHLLALEPNLVIGLIPCAVGGTNIGQWQRNLSENSLYGRCMMRAKAASIMGYFGGILFLQGENDTEGKPEDHPNDWAVFFEKFVGDLRSDLGYPNLPVIYGQIGPNTKNSPIWADVQKQQEAVKLTNCNMIKTSDLQVYPGEGHFTTASQMYLGRRFADAYWELVKDK